ncbi:MAG: presenilin family intramembrane aspartyl protease [Candidatus Woesearchaeota archaeon]
MKHRLDITILLLVIFLLAQFIGIAILYKYIDPVKSTETGKMEFKELPIGERPQVNENYSYLPIMIMVLVGTGLMLILIKYHLNWIWKVWFLLAIFLTLMISFNAFISLKIALFLALLLSLWRTFWPNILVQNFTEVFIYGGLAAIFVPAFNLWSIIILLILISVYDAYAVWKSKHMITLAQSQAKSKVFAGLLIPYTWKKKGKEIGKGKEKPAPEAKSGRIALLGGGDIAFPLLFAGVILKEMGLWQALVIPFFALLGLALLLFFSKEKRFYPAMPFISAGCFLGLAVVWVISLF